MNSQCDSDQGIGRILVVRLGRCSRISSVYRVFQPASVGTSSVCVCDCKRRTRESFSESENGSLSRSGMDRVGFCIGDPVVHGFLTLMGRVIVEI